MKKFTILAVLLLLFSCQKKEPTIYWEKDISFSEIIENSSDQYVMIDFVKNG